MRSSLLPLSRLAALAAFALGSAAQAQTVGGNVNPISVLSNVTYVSNLTIVGASAGTNQTIATGQIDNNFENGWKLTVASAKNGKFTRGGGAGGAGREVVYTNISLVNTGGTLGAGLTNPGGTSIDVSSGTGMFNTRATPAALGTATTATVGYTFQLQVSWPVNTTLLSGAYSDTLTLTLADDAL